MKIRRRPRSDVSIELAPLIDVVFLLLIFFMVSTTFIRQSELSVDLPEADSQQQQLETDIVEVTISADGEYAVNGRMLVDNSLATLMRALSDTKTGDKRRKLVINADANARHQSVVRAMDAAGQLGLTQLSITTRSPEEAE
jgi:biopolymer transport protein ExbD